MKRSVRTLPALAIAAGMLVSLAACTPPVTNLAGCAAPHSAGDNSDAVTASGNLGSTPKVEFPTPLVANDGQVSVIERGDGAIVYPGNTVELFITTFNPETGEEESSTGYDEPRRSLTSDDVFAQFTECFPAGSRIAIVANAGSIYGDDEGASAAGVDPSAMLVAVVDIHETYLGKANGWDQLPQAGVPSVVRAPNGEPGIIVPNEDPPADLRIALLKAGTGDTVEKGDDVVLQYTGLVWGNESPFDSSWIATAEKPAAPVVLNTEDVVPGFAQALIGQKVGSQVLAVIPPELGYGDTAQQTIPAGSTLIFVIDILKIQD